MRPVLRVGSAALVATLVGAGLAGCSSGPSPVPTATEVVTVTGSAAASPSASSSEPNSKPKSKSKSSAGDPAALKASFATFSSGLSQPVGVSIVAVGGGNVVSLGDSVPRVAWSTIKVPLALAAQRANGISAAETSAIISSDNAAAETLWASLGTPEQAAKAVTAILREGKDTTTVVPAERQRAEFTIFGQTLWALNDAARFTAHLPCLPDAEHVVQLMGQVAGNQRWGVETISAGATAVKGGWGPGESGGYVVRQIGLLTRADGAQIAFALSTYAAGSSMETGIAALDQAGAWIGEHLDSMPAGNC